MHDDELDRFKRDINLVEYASDRHGYRRRARESSRSSHVLHHATTHDKILVARDEDGHWVYCSVRDGHDQGTIVDFLQRRQRLDLGQVRKELRDWLHTPRPDPGPSRRPDTPVVVRDRHAVALAYAVADAVPNSAYLNARGIRPETLQSRRFASSWKRDRRGNLLFPHRDEQGLSGFEIKSHGFTGFATGGRKALWQSARHEGDSVVVVCESAIDALSYQQLHRLRGARYISLAGAMSPAQLELLGHTLARLAPSVTVVAAVDADLAGRTFAAQLEQATAAHALTFARHSPEAAVGKDWNEVLQRVEHDFIAGLCAPRRVENAR